MRLMCRVLFKKKRLQCTTKTVSLPKLHQPTSSYITLANSAFYPSGAGKWVPAIAGKAKAGMAYIPIADWTCGCAGKTVRSLENTCHTWALLRWWFTKRRYIKRTYLYLYLTSQWHYTSPVTDPLTCLFISAGHQKPVHGRRMGVARWNRCRIAGVTTALASHADLAYCDTFLAAAASCSAASVIHAVFIMSPPLE